MTAVRAKAIIPFGGAFLPLSLAISSSGDGNFGIAAFVPSRSMKVGHALSGWKVLRRGVKSPGSEAVTREGHALKKSSAIRTLPSPIRSIHDSEFLIASALSKPGRHNEPAWRKIDASVADGVFRCGDFRCQRVGDGGAKVPCKLFQRGSAKQITGVYSSATSTRNVSS
jgi:hypothetical protein